MSILFSNYVPTSRNYGSYNKDSEDYGSLASGKPKETKAYCTSSVCCRYKIKTNPETQKEVYGVRPRIRKDTNLNNCPDCGDALLWR